MTTVFGGLDPNDSPRVSVTAKIYTFDEHGRRVVLHSESGCAVTTPGGSKIEDIALATTNMLADRMDIIRFGVELLEMACSGSVVLSQLLVILKEMKPNSCLDDVMEPIKFTQDLHDHVSEGGLKHLFNLAGMASDPDSVKLANSPIRVKSPDESSDYAMVQMSGRPVPIVMRDISKQMLQLQLSQIAGDLADSVRPFVIQDQFGRYGIVISEPQSPPEPVDPEASHGGMPL